MARRRYISSKISTDKSVVQLAKDYGEFACLLYTWLIPHAEDNGCINADVEEILMLVIPGFRWKSADDVMAALDGMDKLKLISWDKEKNIISFPSSFFSYQSYIGSSRKNKAERVSAKHQENINTAENNETPQNTAERRKTPLCLGLGLGLSLGLGGSSPTAESEAPEDLPLSEGEVTDAEPPVEPTEQKPKTPRQKREEFDFEVTFDEFADLWNRHMPGYGLTQIIKITPDRERAFKDRVLEDPAERNDIAWWGDVLQFTTESDFLMGKSPPQEGHKPWKMSADWLIGSGTEVVDGQRRTRDGTMLTRLLEGNHHDGQLGGWVRGEYERSAQNILPVAGTG